MKKLLIVPLAAVLTVGVLTGCSKVDKDPTAPTPVASATETPAETPKATPTEDPTNEPTVADDTLDLAKLSSDVEAVLSSLHHDSTDAEFKEFSDSLDAAQNDLFNKGVQYLLLDSSVDELTDEQVTVVLEALSSIKAPVYEYVDYSGLTDREKIELNTEIVAYFNMGDLYADWPEDEVEPLALTEKDVKVIEGEAVPTVELTSDRMHVFYSDTSAVFTNPEGTWLVSGKNYLENIKAAHESRFGD